MNARFLAIAQDPSIIHGVDRSRAALSSLRAGGANEKIDRLIAGLEDLRRGIEERFPSAAAMSAPGSTVRRR